jgi:broad specificity phosphatase PhoE
MVTIVRQSMRDDTLFLVRHGRTAWNEQGRFQGRSDLPLSPAGHADALASAEKLAAHLGSAGRPARPVLLFSSPLLRSLETAAIVAEALDIPAAAIIRDERLAEAGFGGWEGLTTHEVKARFPAERRARKANRWTFAPPGGESYAEIATRMKFFIDELPRDHIALVVTHSGNLRVILGMLDEAGREQAMRRTIPHDRPFRWSDGRLMEI